jgi:hypothetical protein
MTSSSDREQRIARLATAAATRTAGAEARARRAIIKLENSGQPVSFVSVARTAQVSTSFLYQHTAFRAEIMRRRSSSRPGPQSATESASDASLRTKLRVALQRCSALTAELAALRAENEALRGALIERRS